MNFTFDQIHHYVVDRFPGQRVPMTAEVKLRCPLHDDTNPSLSFNQEKGVWRCHAGCGDGGLIAFEQKLNGGTPEEAIVRIAELMGEDHLFESQKNKPVAIYTYRDAIGREVFEKLRYQPKRFTQRKPDGKGGYLYKLGDCPKPLYRLPEVLTANTIIVTEGEKDADRVASLRLSERDPNSRVAATTNFAGAGKWPGEYSIYFAGKQVVILGDNDDAGRRHAEMVAISVAKYAVGVKVVALPGLAEHGDVSDYLDSHTADELIEEIKRAPVWHPEVSAHVMLAEGAQFSVAAPPETDWVVKGVIQKGGNGIVTGEPKAGKSLAMLDLLLAIATGTPWLGFPVPRRMKCALVSREDYPGLTGQRIGNLFRGREKLIDWEGWIWVNSRFQTPQFLLENDADVSQLIKEMRMEQVEFACFDVFRKLHLADENDNTEMARVLDQLTRIQSEVGCAIALVHHTNRDVGGSIFRRIRGATAIHGWTEWGIGISVNNPGEPVSQWVRKVEFETKAACPTDPVYFRIEGPTETLRLTLTDPPEASRIAAGRSVASYMEKRPSA
jgi:hypothetical protein